MNECVENKAYDKIYEINKIKSITPYYLSANELYIDFYCYGLGLVPSSTYYGFYYVSNDEPLGFQSTPPEIGIRWRWVEMERIQW